MGSATAISLAPLADSAVHAYRACTRHHHGTDTKTLPARFFQSVQSRLASVRFTTDTLNATVGRYGLSGESFWASVQMRATCTHVSSRWQANRLHACGGCKRKVERRDSSPSKQLVPTWHIVTGVHIICVRGSQPTS